MPLAFPARSLCVLVALACLACSSMPGTPSVLQVPASDHPSVQVRLPPGYDSTRAYPILIGLHGRGGRAERFLELWKTISKHDVIYIVPEAPFPYDYGFWHDLGFYHGFCWFRNRPPDSARIAQDRARSEDYVAAVAKAALARYGGQRAYLLGFSQGGNLAYHAGLGYRELFQGIIAFGTYLDMGNLSPEKRKDATGLKVSITHGKRDKAIAFPEGEAARENLKALGCEVAFREFPGGHQVDEASLDSALMWMLPGSRNGLDLKTLGP